MLTRLAVLAGSVLLATEGRLLKHENYNSAYVSYPSHIYTPSSVWEIWHIVRRAKWQGKRVRVVGSHVHSWGGLSMSDEGQVVIDTEKFNDILDLDTAKKPGARAVRAADQRTGGEAVRARADVPGARRNRPAVCGWCDRHRDTREQLCQLDHVLGPGRGSEADGRERADPTSSTRDHPPLPRREDAPRGAGCGSGGDAAAA